MKTLEQVIVEAEAIMAAHEEGLEIDCRFDAGEFSRADHYHMMDKEITELAEVNGFTSDRIYNELMRRVNEEQDHG